MKLVIDIPEDFLEDFNKDRFEDSLMRLSNDAHILAGRYEQEVATMLINAIKNGTPYEERPKGKWVEGEQDGSLLGLVPYYRYNCSECGYHFSLNRGSKKPNYCQECGADMRGDV